MGGGGGAKRETGERKESCRPGSGLIYLQRVVCEGEAEEAGLRQAGPAGAEALDSDLWISAGTC